MSIAIVGPAFFGYLRRIAALMTERGIPARFYDEFPSNKILAKIALRYSPLPIRQRAARQYHDTITNQIIGSGATHVLFGTIEMFPRECIRRLRDHGIIMCRYAWDSVANKPFAKTLDPFLRAVASFDPSDCEREGYKYIPLYSAATVPEITGEPDIDFLYCATFHSNRPQVVATLLKASSNKHWRVRLMLFFHSKELWYSRFLFKPWMWKMGRLITTQPYTLDEIAEATARSRVVIDIHHHGQSGLTMRTFEALSLGAIVLTTNAVALEGLPEALLDRIVVLDVDNAAQCMEEALARPRVNSSAEMRYYLSADRFLDQIIALLLGSKDIAKARGVPKLAS
jgi:hypothetical protein